MPDLTPGRYRILYSDEVRSPHYTDQELNVSSNNVLYLSIDDTQLRFDHDALSVNVPYSIGGPYLPLSGVWVTNAVHVGDSGTSFSHYGPSSISVDNGYPNTPTTVMSWTTAGVATLPSGVSVNYGSFRTTNLLAKEITGYGSDPTLAIKNIADNAYRGLVVSEAHIVNGDIMFWNNSSTQSFSFARSAGNVGIAWQVNTKNAGNAQTSRITLTGGENIAKFCVLNSRLGINTASPGAILHSNADSAVQGLFSGYSFATSAAGTYNGSIAIGSDSTVGLILSYDNASATTSYIDSRYDSSSSQIRFRARTAGTAVNIMTLTGAGYVGIGTTSPSYQLDLTASARIPTIYSRNYYQTADGIPSTNLGTPTVTEMALFDPQFDNKTAYFDISKITIESYDGATWTDVTSSFSDTIKRNLVGGDTNSSFYIPYGTVKYRITFANAGYVCLNALYMYLSGNGHSMQVHIWKHAYGGAWEQHTSSTTLVGGWPAHCYMPFAAIWWNPSAYHDQVRIEFTPTWNGTYPSNNFSIYKIELWGGYPAGRRTVYSVDGEKNITHPAAICASTNVSAGVALGSVAARMHSISSSTDQLRLGYSTSYYTSFTTDSAGDLTISPIGKDIVLAGSGSWYNGQRDDGTSVVQLIRSKGMGYDPVGYPGVQIGTAGNHIALFIDPGTISGGSFNGYNNEIVTPNILYFHQANAGSTNWLNNVLTLNNANVGFGTPTPSALIHGIKTTEQLRLAYDATNYTSFFTDSAGRINIKPTNGVAYLSTAALKNSLIIMDYTGTNRYSKLSGDSLLNIDNDLVVNSITTSGTVFNEQGADIDFRIESDTDPYLFVVDASTSHIGIGLISPNHTLDIAGDIKLGSVSDGYSRLLIRSKTARTYPTAAIVGIDDDINSEICIGGGTSVGYIAKQISFHTAANNTTVGSAQKMSITSSAILQSLPTSITTTTTPQFSIKYDGTYYTDFSTSSAGYLTIKPTHARVYFDLSTTTVSFGAQSATGDIPIGTSLTMTGTNRNLTIASDGNGAAYKVVGAAYNGSTWRSMYEYANVAAGEPNLILVKSAGNVGIGALSPKRTLDIRGISNAGFIVASSGSGGKAAGLYAGSAGVALDYDDTGSFSINSKSNANIISGSTSGGTTRLFIDSSGNIGINTTIPNTKLEVLGTPVNTGYGDIFTINTNSASTGYYGSLVFRQTSTNIGARITSGNAGAYRGFLAFEASNNAVPSGLTDEFMRITYSSGYGRLGVGTASPSYKIHLVGSGSDLTSGVFCAENIITSGNAGAGYAMSAYGNSGYLTAFASSYADSFYADRIMLNANSTSAGISIAATTTGQNIKLYAGSSSPTIVLDAGNVGIGTITPTQKLDIRGNTYSSGILYCDNTSPTIIESNRGATSASQIVLGANYSPTVGSTYSTANTFLSSNARQVASADWWVKGSATYSSNIVTLGLTTDNNRAAFSISHSPANTASGVYSNFFPRTLFTVMESGKVGIGNANPVGDLHITKSAGAANTIWDQGSNAMMFGVGSYSVIQTSTDFGILYTTRANIISNPGGNGTYYLWVRGSTGDVGIGYGSTTPDARLHVVKTSEQLRLGYDGNSYASFSETQLGTLDISTVSQSGDGTINFYPANGNVYLRKGSLNNRLYIMDYTRTGAWSQLNGSAFSILTSGGNVHLLDAVGTTVFNEQGSDLDFRIEGDTESNLFYIDASTDRIGVATATPAYRLDIGNNTNDTIRIGAQAVNNGVGSLLFGSKSITAQAAKIAGIYGPQYDGALVFYTQASGVDGDRMTERMRIGQQGNVAIGSTTLTNGTLFVNGTIVAATAVYLGGGGYAEWSGASGYSRISIWANSTYNEIMRTKFDGAAKIGIGTNNPAMALEINNASGDALRLTYNDANGGATTYADLLMTSGGTLNIIPTGSQVGVSGTLRATTIIGANVTSGVDPGHTHSIYASGTHNHAGVYEPVISAGTTAQYWRGDKSWQTLDKTAVGLGNVENTALSTWAGSANITTLGTVTTGTWNAGNIIIPSGTVAAPSLAFINDSNTGICSPSGDQISFSTGGTQRLFIDNNGYTAVRSRLYTGGATYLYSQYQNSLNIVISDLQKMFFGVNDTYIATSAYGGSFSIRQSDTSGANTFNVTSNLSSNHSIDCFGVTTIQYTISPQLYVKYDNSNYYSTTVSSNGEVTFDAVGTYPRFVFNDRISCPGTGTLSERFGVGASGTGNYQTLIGSNVSATNKDQCVGIGWTAIIDGNYGVAIGTNAHVTDAYGIAIGYGAHGNNQSVAIGGYANATNGAYGVAVGYESWGIAYGVGVGNYAIAYHDSVAIGANTGYTSRTPFIAIGRGAVPAQSNQIAMGSASYPMTSFRINSNTAALDLMATSGTYLTVAANNAGLSTTLPFAFPSGSVTAPSLSFINDSNTGIYSPSTNYVAVAISGIKKAEIYASGLLVTGDINPTLNQTYSIGNRNMRWKEGCFSTCVRIGKDNDSNLKSLHIKTGTPSIALEYASDSSGALTIAYNNTTNDHAYFSTANNRALKFQTGTGGSSSDRLVITGSGNIGINTSSPVARLHVIDTVEALRIGYDTSNYYSTTVSSAGAVTLDAVGTGAIFTFNDQITCPGSGTQSERFGFGAHTRDSYGTAVGRNTIGGYCGVSVGTNASSFSYGIAIGNTSSAAQNGVTVGTFATSNGGVTIGKSAAGVSSGGTLIGADSYCYGDIGIGGLVVSSGTASIAIGYGAQSRYTSAFAFGAYARTTAANQFMLGSVTYPITNHTIYTNGNALALATNTGTYLTVAASNASLSTTLPFGVGAASPSAALHVKQTTEQLRLGYDDTHYTTMTVNNLGGTTFDQVGYAAGLGFFFGKSIYCNGADNTAQQFGGGTALYGNSLALGYGALASGLGSVAAGYYARAGDTAVAIGSNAIAGAYSVAVGLTSNAGARGVALGKNVSAAAGTFQVGQSAVSTGTQIGTVVFDGTGTELTINGGSRNIYINPLAGTFGVQSSGVNKLIVDNNGVSVSGTLYATSLAGSIIIPSGTIAIPSLSFTNDSNTGLFSPSGDCVAITTNGTQRIIVDPSGFIGIGTSTPQEKLEINGDIRFSHITGGTRTISITQPTSSYTDGTNLVIKAGSGASGSGATWGGTLELRAGNPNSGGADRGGDVRIYAGDNQYGQTTLNGDIILYTGHTSLERMRILGDDNTGNIGIGTVGSTVSARLHIISTTEQLRVGYDASNYYSTTVSSVGAVAFDAVGTGAIFTFSDRISCPGSGTGSERFGANSFTRDIWGTAVGTNAIGGSFGVALGAGASSFTYATAIGYNSSAVQNAIAIGMNSSSNGGVTIGKSAIGASNAGTLIGADSYCFGDIGIGGFAVASGNYTIAIGYGSQSRYANSFAFGGYAKTTTTNQFMLGSITSPITNHTIYSNTGALALATNTGTYLTVAAANANLTTTLPVGIGTSAPDRALEVNSATGDCLRLTYNDSNGSATSYTDFGTKSTGQSYIYPASNIIHVGVSGTQHTTDMMFYSDSGAPSASLATIGLRRSIFVQPLGYSAAISFHRGSSAGEGAIAFKLVSRADQVNYATKEYLRIDEYGNILAKHDIQAADLASAKIHVIHTTEQLRLGYNDSNYYSTTVSSTGGVTFDAVGTGAKFTFSDRISSPDAGSGSERFGDLTFASGTFSTAVGQYATVPAVSWGGTAIGNRSIVGPYGTSLGYQANAAQNGVSIGLNSVARYGCVTIGKNAVGGGVLIGVDSLGVSSATGMGESVIASGIACVAIGSYTDVRHNYSIGLGAEAKTTATYQCMIGSAAKYITNHTIHTNGNALALATNTGTYLTVAASNANLSTTLPIYAVAFSGGNVTSGVDPGHTHSIYALAGSGSSISTFGSGTALLPSITFTDDLNTGIYQPLADHIAISTSGVQRVLVDVNGNVGLGTSTPYTKLSIKASPGDNYMGGISFQRNSTKDTWAFTIGSDNNFYYGYATNASNADAAGDYSTKFKIQTDGGTTIGSYGAYVPPADSLVVPVKLGVGTYAPSATIHAVNTTEQLRVGYDVNNYRSSTMSSAGYLTDNFVGTSTGYKLAFASTDRYAFTAAGLTLTVTGGCALTITNQVGNTSDMFNINGLGGSGGNLLKFTYDGNLGIGTTSISAQLHCVKTSEQLRLGYDVSNYVSFTTSSVGDLTIGPTGNDVTISANTHILSDSNKYICGAGNDAAMYYNGTDAIIESDLVAASDLHIKTGTGKTLVLDSPVYEDLKIGPSDFEFGGVGDPSIASWQPGGGMTFKVREFKANQEGFFTCQVPHGYATGQNIGVHVHWTPGARGVAESGKTVAWKLDASWANINDVFPSSTRYDLTDTCTGVNDKHEMTSEVWLSGVNKGISSMLVCRIFRDTGDTWAGSTPGISPYLLEVDFHIPINTLGSRVYNSK